MLPLALCEYMNLACAALLNFRDLGRDLGILFLIGLLFQVDFSVRALNVRSLYRHNRLQQKK
jgi:hypothetical protein